MKYFLTTLTFLLFFNGCSYNNAYTKFNMSNEEELFASNTQSSKIESENSIDGVFTAIYLNNVYKNREEYKNSENFLIVVYIKEGSEDFTFQLNGNYHLKVEVLASKNRFTKVLKSTKEWETYYLVKFKKQVKELNLLLSGEESSSVVLHYQKESK